MTKADLKGFRKNKKLIKRWEKDFDAFMARCGKEIEQAGPPLSHFHALSHATRFPATTYLALLFWILTSESLIKEIPRILGPRIGKAGKFPVVLKSEEDVANKAEDIRATVKFKLSKSLCLNVAVGHANLAEDQLVQNVQLTCNFLASLLKKKWQNIKTLHIKSTMGPSFQIYF